MEELKYPITDEEFAKLLEEEDKQPIVKTGDVVEGTVIKVTDREAFVDIGAKSEGVIPLSEFRGEEVKPGDKVQVYVERLDPQEGIIRLSKHKADFLLAWDKIKEAYNENRTVEAKVLYQVKGGFMVEVFGVEAFLPGSQVDLKKVKNFSAFVGKTIPVKVVKINKPRKNIVVSRKEVLEEELERARERLMSIKPGDEIEGVVKSITDFGVFVDVGGVDGLIHISDLAWTRVKDPHEVVQVGEKVKVKVLSVDPENLRLSLSLKHMMPHPWEKVAERYPIGSKVKGRVTGITDFGAFVELEPGIEGLVHISEMQWGQPPAHPSEVVRVGEEVEVVVLNVDVERQRISLGLKQAKPDPWADIEERYPEGSEVEGKVVDFDNYGAYVELEPGITGYLHISNISWTKRFSSPEDALSKGQRIKVKVLEIDKKSRLVEVSLKHTRPNPWIEIQKRLPRGTEVKAPIVKVTERGVVVEIDEGLEGFVPQSHLQRRGNPKENYQVGQEISLVVLEVEPDRKRVVLSEREFARRVAEREREELAAKFKPEPARINLGAMLRAELQKLDELRKQAQEQKSEEEEGETEA